MSWLRLIEFFRQENALLKTPDQPNQPTETEPPTGDPPSKKRDKKKKDKRNIFDDVDPDDPVGRE